VEESENGEVAWETINRKLIACRAARNSITDELSLVVTDIEMPQMNGLHLTTKFRGEKDLNNLPLIIFSSMVSEDNIRKWRNLGVNDILTKPDLPNLVKVVDNLLQGQTALT